MILQRLKKIEKYLQEQSDPDEEALILMNMSDEELTKYIKDSIERFHKTGCIKDYAGGVEYYERLFDIGEIPTKEKLKLHLQMEREYFNGDYDISQVAS